MLVCRASYAFVPIWIAPLVALTAGCGSGDSPKPGAAEPIACAFSDVELPEGRCQPPGLPIDMPCPPGELAQAGGGCQAAGVPPEACGDGFEPDGQRGCNPVLPEMPCPRGQMAAPGDTACREVAPCGDDAWGDIAVDAATEFVDRAYAGGGSDGTARSPWTTVQEGVDAAADGAIVAIAEGLYAESVVVAGKRVRLWGRCPGRVTVAGVGSSAAIAISRTASGSEVRGLAVTGAGVGIDVDRASAVTVERVWIHDTADLAVQIVSAPRGALRGSLIERASGVGVAMLASDLTIEGSVVRDIRRSPARGLGWGIAVEAAFPTGQRGALTVRRSLIERTTTRGVSVAGSDATIESTVVRDCQAPDMTSAGFGVVIKDDRDTHDPGTLTMRGSLLAGNHGVGAGIYDSEATVESTVVRDNQPDNTGEYGVGIWHQAEVASSERRSLTMRSSLLERNHGVSVYITGQDAVLEGSIVRDTLPSGAAKYGRGVELQADLASGRRGTLALRGSLVERNTTVGVGVWGSDGEIEASIVRDTQLGPNGEHGRGVNVQQGIGTGERGTVAIRSSLIERSHGMGLFAEASDVTLETSVVRDTLPDDAALGGRGVSAQANLSTGARSTLAMRGTLVEGSHELGLFVGSSDATLTSSSIQGTQSSSAPERYGDGIAVDDGAFAASCAITSSQLLDNARAGLLLINAPGVISRVHAAGNRFGMVVQGDVRPTLDGNTFEDNDERDVLLGGDLAVPDATPPLP